MKKLKSCFSSSSQDKRLFLEHFRQTHGTILFSFLLTLFFFPAVLFAQNTERMPVTGVITGPDNAPLAGATVTVKGTTIATSSNASGVYTIRANSSDILVFTFVGYERLERAVGNNTILNISLAAAGNTNLDQVVVVGYTSQRKRDITGAVSVINNKDVANIPVGGVDQILQGKAAGVSVTQSTGAPGGPIAMRIRGVGTINNNDPLYIIDGIPTKDGINEISPNDIESISVLKDAASAAIYGARASNGVIIITTRKGKSGRPRVNINSYVGVQKPADLIKMANTQQYITAYNNAAIADSATNKRTLIPTGMIDTLPDVNWLKEVLKPALITNSQIAVSGGNETSTYIVSANYFKQDGLIMNSGFERVNLRTALTTKISKIFSMGTNVNFSYGNTRQVGSSGDGFGAGNPGPSVVRYALFRTPATPVYNSNGDYVDLPTHPEWFGDGLNPVGLAANTDRNFYTYSLLGDVYVEAAILKNLKLKTDFGMNFINTDYKQFFPTWGVDRHINSPNSLAQSTAKDFNYNWTNTLTYNTTFSEKHNLTVLLGTEAIQDRINQMSASRTNYTDQSSQFQYLDNGLGRITNGGNQDNWALFSLFGRVNYDYDGRYFATFNARRDGSSRLAEDNRYGNFFSGSVAWRIDKEKFMDNQDIFSLLKLRAGVGQNGNQEISNHAYVSVIGADAFYPFNGTATQGYSITQKGNPNVKWETSTQTDIGLDMGFLKNRLNVTVDYFVKNTSNMLIPYPTPPSSGGAGNPYVNAGKVQNQGVEVEASYNTDFGKDWHMQLSGNVAFLHNKVVSLADGQPIAAGRIDNNIFATLTAQGHPIGAFYLLQTDGIFQNDLDVFTHAYQGQNIKPGDVKFKDISGSEGKPDGVIDDNDRTFVGNPIPKVTYGFTANFQYKAFDLSIFFQGVSGNKIYNQVLTDIEGFYRPFNITERMYSNAWHGEGTSNEFPRLSWEGATNNKRPSTRFLEDGSYLRLKNVQLGYNFKGSWMGKISLSSMRVYVSAQNLFTITKYTGLDPEMYISDNGAGDGVKAVGIDWGTYPAARTFSFGINANF
ncbi:SusC/RagA family TonB-linked outer membrane protein [Pinibacter aurantiacus]|uniref:TonB-dependent receptor n=1 Tax=Pinibacter aurantiacus TaxID=2851599 RepID=A0A9E2S6H3_9BACT|nr:TonB-dependent receptor [Pinibacter aurantiacus]MBV4356547.1 TonB-dependent receptor [Pinibacter aurantiacus]